MSSFNPRIDLSQRDFQRAKAIQEGGLAVARQWYDYNTARKLVSHIKKNGLPESFAYILWEEKFKKEHLALFRLDSFTMIGFVPMCDVNFNVETAVLAVRLRDGGYVKNWGEQ